MDEEFTNVVARASESTESSSPSLEETLGLSSAGDDEVDPVVNLMFQEVVEKSVFPAKQEEMVERRTEAEEKMVGTAKEPNRVDSATGKESPSGTAEESVVSFEEESYDVNELKESEKKTLQGLRAKIEESINENTFFAPTKPKTDRTKWKKKEASKKTVKGKGRKGKAEAKVNEKIEAAGADIRSTEVAEPESPLPLSVEPSEEVVKEEEEAAAVEDETVVATTKAHDSVIEKKGEKATTNDALIEQDDSVSLQELCLWGVSLLPSKGDERLDVILLKFLRARNFKVNDAFSMLQKTMIWRRKFKADTLIDEEIATTEFDSVAYIHGYDKQGHPVCYNHFGVFQDKELHPKTFDDEGELNRFLRWRIQLLEKGIQQLDFKPGGVNSMVQVTDLEDFPGLLKRRNVTKKFVSLLQENYPELVAKQIIINAPWYFGALYSLPGLALTRRFKKIVLARPPRVLETLFRYISPECVPLQYGGLSRPNDTEFEDEVPVRQVIVKASEKQIIELPVKESGTKVTWDVAVVGWDVVYGEEFVPSGEGGYTVIIQKSKKIGLSEETIRNSFKVNEPGNIVLTIDNTSTKKNRLAVYRYKSKELTSSAA